MMNARLKVLSLLALCTPFASAAAQVVRGVVNERDSRSPIGGAVVTLEPAPETGQRPETKRSVLTNERGEYAVRAPVPGRYRVSAKRIGVSRFTSDEFDLNPGETRRIDVTLDAVLFTLPEVVVNVNTLCAVVPNQARRLAALWDEARTALTATQISLRDRLIKARIARYVRVLDARSLRVLNESRSFQEGMTDRPFRSLSADSLSKVGYWRELPGNIAEYYGPDAEVLMSDPFLRDHCFTVVDGTRDRRGLTGLAFEPVRNRDLPDVRGTIWLDGKSFALQLVEFQYTRVAQALYSDRVGGQVHFARLPSGAWVVRRWFIRMPEYASSVVRTDLGSPLDVRSPQISRLREEGGDVTAEGMRSLEKPATLIGVVSDSAGSPLGGATVHLAGTPFRTSADPAGNFRMDSLPPGRYTVVADHDGYRAFGFSVDDDEVSLEEGGSHRVSLRAMNTETLVERLCFGRKPVESRATLRVTMLDSVAGTPLARLRVRLSWMEYGLAGGTVQVRPRQLEGTTDAAGRVAFCELPDDVSLELGIAVSPQGARAVASFRLAERAVAARTVRARTR